MIEWIHVCPKYNSKKQLTDNEKIDLTVLAIKGEYLANQFDIKKIINLSNPGILKIKNKTIRNGILSKKVKSELENKEKIKKENGLDIIKKQLNIK